MEGELGEAEPVEGELGTVLQEVSRVGPLEEFEEEAIVEEVVRQVLAPHHIP